MMTYDIDNEIHETFSVILGILCKWKYSVPRPSGKMVEATLRRAVEHRRRSIGA